VRERRFIAAHGVPRDEALGPRTPAGLRRLMAPRAVAVRAGTGGVPEAVEGRTVEAALEDWVIEDRWWTEQPLRRRYLELVLAGGRNVVVFHDLEGGGWYAQRA
jgi:hypothetical protein